MFRPAHFEKKNSHGRGAERKNFQVGLSSLVFENCLFAEMYLAKFSEISHSR